MPAQVLSIGSNPNLAFYSWRLFETKQVELTVVNRFLTPDSPIKWTSTTSLGSKSYSPHQLHQSISSLPKNGQKYEIVLLNASSLQDFQSLCTDILPFINEETIIVVESSGYINLEPFAQMSFPPKMKKMSICSIMNESDVRQVGPTSFHHTVRANDSRIYIGSSVRERSSDLAKSTNFQRMYRLLQVVQEESNGAISLLKSLNAKEFMTYQWKLALPRIAFYSLSIIFESEFPEQLASQILCKPLISGIINEIFKIIKKMDCKLVKGFENEANLLKNQIEIYPVVEDNSKLMNSNPLLYNFSRRLDLEVDLLLLQPILLGDDNGIRTPYLENLYSMLCQYIKINKGNNSMFFDRRGSPKAEEKEVKPDPAQVKQNADLTKQLEQLKLDISAKSSEFQSFEAVLAKQQAVKSQVDNSIVQSENRLRELQNQIQQAERSLENVNIAHEARIREMKNLHVQTQDFHTPRAASPGKNSRSPERKESPSKSGSVVPNQDQTPGSDNLADFADIVTYGDSYAGPNSVGSTPRAEGKQAPEQNTQNGQPVQNTPPQNGQNPNGQFQTPPPSGQNSQIPPPNGQYNQLPPQNGQFPPPNGQFNPQQVGQFNQQYAIGPGYNNYNNQKSYFDVPVVPFGPNGPNGHVGHPSISSSPIEQHPPHGLPANGLPPGQLPSNLRGSGSMVSNVNRYQQNGYPQNGPPVGRLRVSSIPSSINHYDQGPPGPGGYGYNNYNNNPASFNNAAPIDPLIEQRFRNNPKRNNRRSAFPQMNGNLDGLDMGGRGGMPTSTFTQQKHRSMNHIPTQQMAPPGPSKSLSSSAALTVQQQSSSPVISGPANTSGNYLQPPAMNDSNVSSNSSTKTSDTPSTSDKDLEGYSISVPVPVPVENAKPLGQSIATASLTQEKKKRGFFGKKKS